MNELSPEALNSLSREELIALIVQLFAEVRRLQAEVDRLKKPPTTSQNSSQPPSRDQKRNLAAGRPHHRRGVKPGHAKAERPLSDHPDNVDSPQAWERCDSRDLRRSARGDLDLSLLVAAAQGSRGPVPIVPGASNAQSPRFTGLLSALALGQ